MKALTFAAALVAALGTAFGAYAAQAVKAPAACRAEAQVGWVALVEADEALPSFGAAPSIARGRAPTFEAIPGEPLCVDDLLDNPKGSGLKVFIRAGDQTGWIRPGASKLLRRPKPSGWLQAHAAPFADLLRSYRGRALSEQRVRGANCMFNPPEQIDFVSNVALDWGPLILVWPCDGEGPWELVVSGPDGKGRGDWLTQNVTKIDPRADCPEGCLIMVTNLSTKKAVYITQVQIADPASAHAPAWIRPGEGGSAAMAALGVALMAQKPTPPTWRLQGQSLLINNACDVPAAAVLAASAFGASSPEDFCFEWRSARSAR